MQRRFLGRWAATTLAVLAMGLSLPSYAADEAPDVLISRLSGEVLDALRADKSIKAGEIDKVILLVDRTIMPNVNFRRMTSAAVGPGWRRANAQQQQRLQEEFKTLLVRTYAGALSQVNEQTIVVKPLRASPNEKDVLVRTEVRGRGDPTQLDYRLEKTPGVGAGWKIYNINVLGVWLVDTYRTQFGQEINAKGVDGLIQSIAARNASNATKR